MHLADIGWSSSAHGWTKCSRYPFTFAEWGVCTGVMQATLITDTEALSIL